jgi:hypothetical protein
MKPMKRYLIILLFLIIGIGFGIGFGAVFYVIRKKKDDQITMGGSIKETIIPSIFFWVTIGILIVVKMEYCIPLQLFILSAIILASFLSAISSKKAWLFFLGFGIVITQLGLEALIRRFVEWVNCTNEKRKLKILAESASNIISPKPSAPPISSFNNKNQQNIISHEVLKAAPSAPPVNNSSQASAPPLNNSLKASAPPVNNE